MLTTAEPPLQLQRFNFKTLLSVELDSTFSLETVFKTENESFSLMWSIRFLFGKKIRGQLGAIGSQDKSPMDFHDILAVSLLGWLREELYL